MSFFDRLGESLQRLWEFVPALFGAAVVLTAGYFVAKLAQKAVTRVLRRMRLNDVLERGGVPALDYAGARVDPTRVTVWQ